MIRTGITSVVAGIMMLAGTIASAQSWSTWPRYTFGSLFSISVPTTLELRDPDSAVGKLMDGGREAITMKMGQASGGATTVFWPGLSSSKYARIMVNASTPSELTQQDMAALTTSDMKQLDEVWKQQNRQIASMTGVSIQWIGSWREIYGGKYTFHIAYQRSGLEGSVRVDEYKIYDKGKEILFTISYRIKEESTWKEDLQTVMKSLRF